MKKIIFSIALFLGAAVFLGAAEEVYRNDFNTPESIDGFKRNHWHTPDAPAAVREKCPTVRYQSAAGIDGSGCLEFASQDPDCNFLMTLPLDLEKVRGRGVILEGWMKAESLTAPKIDYLGPKLMLTIATPIERNHPDQTKKYGTYGWQKFTAVGRVGDSATEVILNLGLQGCTGKVWLDDVRVTLEPLPQAALKPLTGQLPAQKQTLRRGVMSGDDLSEEAFRELRDVWRANLFRFQISRPHKWDNTTREGYRRIIDHNLKKLDNVLPLAQKYGLKIVIDMHVGPGTKVNGLLSNQLSYEPEMQQLFIDVWREIARKYRGNPVIYGYDLLNEPREEAYVPGRGMNWRQLGEAAAKAIREEDPDTPIIFEAAPWGGPAALDGFVPIDVPKVIYSIHYYRPGTYTHQGVMPTRPVGVKYPGVVDGEYFDKARLEKGLQPAIEFQKKYNVPIYVGEFGVARWAPNGEQWLDDLISIFEKYGWDWTFHAYREWDGWDAEIGPVQADRTRVGDTPRRRVLLKYMHKNVEK